MKVYCEENGELLDLEGVTTEVAAALEAHSRGETSEEDGCRGTYRVQGPEGFWAKLCVVTVVTVRYDATFEGECPAPELGSGEGG